MDWIQFGVQWLHVIFAIFWFGGTMYLDFVVVPTLQRVAPLTGREVGRALAPRIATAMRIAGLVVIVLGVLRGTVVGLLPPHGSVSFGSTYGITWSISILIAIVIVGISDGVIARLQRTLYADDSLWARGSDGRPAAAFLAISARLRTWSIVQVVLFVLVFTCMVYMRFLY